ncbi:hypothetical protein KC19_7G112700 [Ceratodon purpureus]|uniref:Cyclin N-terminal domain-containing protein n=1 Tax=Ceratodon purpureus TaxID=3225 RepID=A0A8T0HAB5_CERPU|nr:hypothetical protein KC19_7G112700 [Ceratodon purpureus]
MFATRQQSGFGDENKRGEGGKAAVPAKAVAGIGARNTRAAQASNRRALGDIGNLVGAMSVRCNVSKDGVLENAVVKQAALQTEAITRPITRRFGANLQNTQAAARVPQPVAQPPAEAVKVEGKSAEDVAANWGATKRRTTQPKPRETNSGSSESQAASAETVSTNSSVASNQIGNPARLKAHTRSKVVKKEKEQTLTATLTERSEIARRVYDAEMHEAEEPIPNIDQHDEGNQLAVVDYIEDIYSFYRKSEVQSCVPADYMSRQSDINEKMRAILIDWLIEVHLKFKLMPETLYLTTNLIDRYLCTQSVSRKNLQLVGVTAMLLAAKYEEIWAPEVNDFVHISDNAYTRDEVLTMEKNMLNTLKFNLTVPTPYVFIVRFLKASACDKQEKTVSAQLEMVAWFLVELCLTEYPMLKYAPSLIAAAAVYTAQVTLARQPRWGPALQRHSGYTEAHIKECASMMANLHSKASEGNLTVVHKKYSQAKLLSVAKLPYAASLCTAHSSA